jgi:hypothetical protein
MPIEQEDELQEDYIRLFHIYLNNGGTFSPVLDTGDDACVTLPVDCRILVEWDAKAIEVLKTKSSELVSNLFRLCQHIILRM